MAALLRKPCDEMGRWCGVACLRLSGCGLTVGECPANMPLHLSLLSSLPAKQSMASLIVASLVFFVCKPPGLK